MAVNSSNYSIMHGMNTTQAAAAKPFKLDPKSDNFSNSQTKFTHSVLDGEEKSSVMFPASVKGTYKAIPMKGKKYKKGRKFLPSLFDDGMLSPREDDTGNSTDFKRPLFKNIKDNIDTGYDTENNAERAEALKFGFTDEGRFNGYESVQGPHDRF